MYGTCSRDKTRVAGPTVAQRVIWYFKCEKRPLNTNPLRVGTSDDHPGPRRIVTGIQWRVFAFKCKFYRTKCARLSRDTRFQALYFVVVIVFIGYSARNTQNKKKKSKPIPQISLLHNIIYAQFYLQIYRVYNRGNYKSAIDLPTNVDHRCNIVITLWPLSFLWFFGIN